MPSDESDHGALFAAIDELEKIGKRGRTKGQQGMVHRSANELRSLLREALAGGAGAPVGEAAAGDGAELPVSAAARAGEAAGREVAGEPDSFAGFFEGLGNGLVSAQRSLDALSEEYLIESESRPHIPPTIFRLPRLQGKLDVGLRVKDEKSVGLVLFRNKQEAEQQVQQSIEFEIGAVPPPADALDAIRVAATTVRQVLSPLEFETLLARARRCLSPGEDAAEFDGDAKARGRAQAALGKAERVAVLRLSANTHVLLGHGELAGDDAVIGGWLLTGSPGEGAEPKPSDTLSSLFEAKKKVTAARAQQRYERLLAVFEEAVERQRFALGDASAR